MHYILCVYDLLILKELLHCLHCVLLFFVLSIRTLPVSSYLYPERSTNVDMFPLCNVVPSNITLCQTLRQDVLFSCISKLHLAFLHYVACSPVATKWLQPSGCNLYVLLTFSCVKEKLTIFPA